MWVIMGTGTPAYGHQLTQALGVGKFPKMTLNHLNVPCLGLNC